MGKNNGLHITVDALCAFSSDKGGLPIDGLHERLQCLISAARLLPCAQQGRPKESLQTFGREAHERSDERKRKGGSLMMSGRTKKGAANQGTPPKAWFPSSKLRLFRHISKQFGKYFLTANIAKQINQLAGIGE